jgi:hypothetical protein
MAKTVHGEAKGYVKVRGGGVIDPGLARELFEYRVDNGLNQRQLSELSGIYQATICEAEQAKCLSLRARLKLRRFLDEQKLKAAQAVAP